MLPLARHELSYWTDKANQIPNEPLRVQALASIQHKRFHADGGSVYAAVDLAYAGDLVKLIIALQTISDYLDNLCDRCDTYNEDDFTQLHHAMRDAVRPDMPPQDYYALRGRPDDGGYLASLVETCRSILRNLPGYTSTRPHVEWLVERYCELQAYKHIEPALRRDKLQHWWAPYKDQFPEIEWWEFAAASGSTLGMFALFLASTRPLTTSQAEKLFDLYFPWICGLHILLDYLIDLDEDRTEGDFNFVQCYPSSQEARERVRLFAKTSEKLTRRVPDGLRIHKDVVRGLLAMYLSDEKVGRQAEVRPHRRLVWRLGPTCWMYYTACMIYRVVR